ncbi:MAG TPA: energy transducer TonB [Candidatus Angelobacter sp.]
MKNKTGFFLLTCVVCLAFSSLLCAQSNDNAAPDAKALLEKAHEVSGPSLVLPYEMRAAVVINTGATETHGRITIYRDKDRSLAELQVEDYRETRLTLGNKLYITRSLPYPVPGLGRLAETDRAWDRLTEDGEATLGNVSHKKVQNTPSECFEVKGREKHRLCFDAARNVLLENLDQERAFVFSDYQSAGKQLFPHKITMLLEEEKSERPVLSIQEIEVWKARFADTAFAIPEHALEFDTCEGMVSPKAQQTPRPEFGMTVARRNAEAKAVHVYAIVNKQGALENVKILSSDAEVRQAVLEVINKWRYTPAMCGSSPVAAEQDIQIPFFEMGGAGEARGGRGR